MLTLLILSFISTTNIQNSRTKENSSINGDQTPSLSPHPSSPPFPNNNLIHVPTTTVYETLQKYGLPSGLLPDSVTNYTLSEDETFEVELEKPCYIQFDYLVSDDKKITGKLGLGSITDLDGIEVKRLVFLWFNVDAIRVDLPPSDTIYFSVGVINKELDIDQFLTVRSCKEKALSLTHKQQVPVEEIPMLLTE